MRNYNEELKNAGGSQYSYDFDKEVMHRYMVESFVPFFVEGNVLELGSYEGDFTKRLLPYFEDITCVEASSDAVSKSLSELGNKVRIIHSTFDEAKLPDRYDNIILTHVLEHLDNPIDLLKKINDRWISSKGRLFLTVPNANAASRQIAVKMNIIPHNTAVTPEESQYGHRMTYSFDTLEWHVKESGLKIRHTSGIFFKALANFQWDKMISSGIVSESFLDGCYQLGKQYPELCASIFFVCEKGESHG